MGAPEKIFIPRLEGNETFVHEWSATKFQKYFSREIAENVEYVRKDAFIEKACEKLEKCMYDNLMFQGRLHRKEVIETFIEDFKKYFEDKV